MKILILLGISSAIFFAACSNEKDSYVDLRTGKTITVEKDPQTGYWVNAETSETVDIYVNTKDKDTIYGRTGATINGHIVKTSDGVYWYDEDDEYKAKYGDDAGMKVTDEDYKKKVEEDGDTKIKDGDTKIKIDGETGEKKVKND